MRNLRNVDARTDAQIAAVIMIDICTKLNKLNLDRTAYQQLFDKEMLERCGQTIPLDLLVN